MLPRICLLLAIAFVISHGSSAKNGSCESEKTTKTNMYMFVGRPHSSSPSYGNPNVMNVEKPVCIGSSAGSDYRGNVSVTISGKTCQRWDVNFPHKYTFLPVDYPELVENYCRNPDEGEPGPWCYTTDPNTRWEFCCNPE
ncbi:hepatocyte growth factor-like [Branchiostoma floridae x Branchiostoma japonicum]